MATPVAADVSAAIMGASADNLDAMEEAIIERRRALLTQETARRAAKRSRSPSSETAFITGKDGEQIALEDIPAMARVPPSAADVAGKKEVRVLLNGCFDIMHAGHYNALRQAKAMFEGFGVKVILVAGVHRSASITVQKGIPVMTDEERQQMVASCKWVDEVVVIPEYLISVAVLDSFNLDFVAHGDDLPIRTDGTGMFHEAIAHGRFRMIKRTEGVSTTTFIGRLLAALRPADDSSSIDPGSKSAQQQIQAQEAVQASSTLLPTGSRITAFAAGMRPIGNAKRVVYVDGIFDVFHIGHIEFLKKARALGDYLLVGLHSDSIAQQTHGPGNPIMGLHERALCVMANKYVDDVIIGVPWVVTKDLCTSMNVAVVAAGDGTTNRKASRYPTLDPYDTPKQMGIYQTVQSGLSLTTRGIQQRIIDNYAVFQNRNKIQEAKAEVYYEGKQHFKEHQ